jgi:ribosomal protein S18 acetylase RimI-like enzyme
MNPAEAHSISIADPADAADIAALAGKTFLETYNGTSIEAHLAGYVEEHFTVEAMRRELQTPGFQFLIARVGDKMAGYAKLRRDRQPRGISEAKCMQLERIYILKAYQARGIGQLLIDAIRGIARSAGDRVLWLQVWQQNEQALAFYHKAGFTICDTAAFHLGSEVTQDYIMRSDIYP